jgi:hypothetical protein
MKFSEEEKASSLTRKRRKKLTGINLGINETRAVRIISNVTCLSSKQ